MKFKFTPSPTFVADAKKKFLAAFDARYPVAAGAPWLVFAARMLGAALAIAAIVMSGATVYADAANVPADSPLYPFKRFGENLQLAVAPPQADASLQAAFAARRVAEINDLQDRHPTSTMIAKLSADADSAVDASIFAADESDLTDGQLTNLCVHLLGTLAASTTAPQGKLHGNLNLLDHFTRQCEAAGNGAASTTEEATGTVYHGFIPAHPAVPAFTTATTSGEAAASGMTGSEEASSSAAATGTPNLPELEMRIQDYLDTHLFSSSSLDLVNPAGNANRGAVIELQGGLHGQSDGGEGGNN